jgi:o-succinylbenzoate---CoA ligase
VLTSHKEIEDVGTTGIPHDEWGQVPCAFIVKRSGSLIGEEDVISFCKNKLAPYKQPKKVIFVDEIPRNASNKILRRVLREQWERGMDRDEH